MYKNRVTHGGIVRVGRSDYVMIYCLSLYSLVGSFDKQFPTKIGLLWGGKSP